MPVLVPLPLPVPVPVPLPVPLPVSVLLPVPVSYAIATAIAGAIAGASAIASAVVKRAAALCMTQYSFAERQDCKHSSSTLDMSIAPVQALGRSYTLLLCITLRIMGCTPLKLMNYDTCVLVAWSEFLALLPSSHAPTYLQLEMTQLLLSSQ